MFINKMGVDRLKEYDKFIFNSNLYLVEGYFAR